MVLFFMFRKNDMDFARVHWNTHYIRKSRFDTIPGKPDALYYLPEQQGHTEQLVEMSVAEIDAFEEQCIRISETNDDNEYHNYFKYVIEQERFSMPDSWKEALEWYIKLVNVAGQ